MENIYYHGYNDKPNMLNRYSNVNWSEQSNLLKIFFFKTVLKTSFVDFSMFICKKMNVNMINICIFFR